MDDSSRAFLTGILTVAALLILPAYFAFASEPPKQVVGEQEANVSKLSQWEMGKKSKTKKKNGSQIAKCDTRMAIHPGIIVKVVGLNKDVELNGQLALCLNLVTTTQRYEVKLIHHPRETPIAVKEENLQLNDDIAEAIYSTDLGKVEHCQFFANSLVARFGKPCDIWGVGETPKIETMQLKGRSLYQINAPAAGHSFIVEFIECHGGSVYSRLFQAFKNNYTAKEWLSKMTWMNHRKTKEFFQNFALLKTKIDAFVIEELIEGLVIPPGKSPTEFSSWYASDIQEQSIQYGQGPFSIGIQPAKWDEESIASYGQERGGLTMTNPNHTEGRDFALCYRVEPWADILRNIETLFQAADPTFFIQSLKTQDSLAWTWMRVLHQPEY